MLSRIASGTVLKPIFATFGEGMALREGMQEARPRASSAGAGQREEF